MACPTKLRTTITVVLMFSLMLLLSATSGSLSQPGRRIEEDKGMKERKMVLGSQPPRCFNKCGSCRPCLTVLVAPPHHGKSFRASSSLSSSNRDETYYLLSWKCKCGGKFFQP